MQQYLHADFTAILLILKKHLAPYQKSLMPILNHFIFPYEIMLSFTLLTLPIISYSIRSKTVVRFSVINAICATTPQFIPLLLYTAAPAVADKKHSNAHKISFQKALSCCHLQRFARCKFFFMYRSFLYRKCKT